MATRRVQVYDGSPECRIVEEYDVEILASAANAEAVLEALDAARQGVRAGIQAARADRQAWAGMTQNQMNRATRDALDREVERGRVLLNLIRALRSDYSTPPEA